MLPKPVDLFTFKFDKNVRIKKQVCQWNVKFSGIWNF